MWYHFKLVHWEGFLPYQYQVSNVDESPSFNRDDPTGIDILDASKI